MKMLEIFYLLIIFNVFLFIFGQVGLPHNKDPSIPGPGHEQGAPGLYNIVTFWSVVLSLTIAGLGGAYASTMIPNVGTAKSPLWVVYIFVGGPMQIFYIAAFTSFWEPIVAMAPDVGYLYALILFLMESIFVIGFIQMTTGGWGLYK